MFASVRTRIARTAAVLVALTGLYAGLGYLVVPRVLRTRAIAFVRARFGRELAVGAVRLDPFALRLEVRDVSFPDADGTVMLGFGRLLVDLEVSSLWHRAWTFKEVRLETPRLRAVVRADGRVNLADLAPRTAPSPPATRTGERSLPRLWVESLAVTGGEAVYLDVSREKPLERQLEGITFALKDFRTTSEGGAFHLSARSEADEQLEWTGRLALTPVPSSQGELSVSHLRAAGLAELAGDALPVRLTSGLIQLAGSYRVALGETLELEAELPSIEVTGLALRPSGADADWVELPRLTLSRTKVALPARSVSVASILLSGAKVSAWREAGGAINLVRMAGPRDAPPAGGPPWKVQVDDVEVREGAVAFEDCGHSPTVRVAIAPIHVALKAVSLELDRPLPLRFEVGINGKGRLTGSGQVTPRPLSASLEVALAGLELRELQPYLSGATALTLTSGTLGLRGQVALSSPGSEQPDASFAGDLSVDALRTTDGAGQELFGFDHLEVSRLRCRTRPPALDADRLLVVRPSARVVVGPDHVLNLVAASHPRARDPAQERQVSPGAVRAKAPPISAAGAARLPVRIAEVRVEGGRLDFSDLSIQPGFRARISDLSGRMTGISSEPAAHARLDLHGKVGPFSPVSIVGEVQPFAYDRFTDLGLRFAGISLPIFNPYSGKFAGYSIARGKLTTDLHYTIRDRKLQATHHVRIDQLEWGEATAQKGAATLPVKFATALLKDAHGVIDLDVPVSGTLDDPSFRVGPIIWQIVKNLITRAVTAPFRALASLFKGTEEAQFVEFSPGDVAIDPGAAGHLVELGRTLASKRELRVVVPYGSLAGSDAAALAMHRYDAELRAAMERTLTSGKLPAGAPPHAFEALRPAQQLAVLTALVRRLEGAPPPLPPPPSSPKGRSSDEVKVLVERAAIAALQDRARADVAPSPADLDQLGQRRTEAIEAMLVGGTGLDPQRVFAARNGKITDRDGKVRLELSLE